MQWYESGCFFKSNAYKVNKLLLINSPLYRIHEKNLKKLVFRFFIQVLDSRMLVVSVHRLTLDSFMQLQFSQWTFTPMISGEIFFLIIHIYFYFFVIGLSVGTKYIQCKTNCLSIIKMKEVYCKIQLSSFANLTHSNTHAQFYTAVCTSDMSARDC